MAEIPIERSRSGMWGGVLGLVALALLAWLLFSLFDRDEPAPVAVAPAVVAPVTPVGPVTPATAPTPIAQGPATVGEVLGSPATYIGRTVQDEVQVVEVPSDRGFWIADQGRRMFVVFPPGGEQVVNVNAGQTVRIREAVVRDPAFLTTMGNISPETRQILTGLPAYLVTDPRNVEVLSAAGAR